jgi:hypothetical protein
MIKDRPKHLMNQGAYGRIPAEPFAVKFDALPELVRKSLGALGGIQPVTGTMMKAAICVSRSTTPRVMPYCGP